VWYVDEIWCKFFKRKVLLIDNPVYTEFEDQDNNSSHVCNYKLTQISSEAFKAHRWPPLWSSGQSSWLQIQRSGFDSRRYQIFREVVDLERGPLSLVSTTEELLGRKSSGSGLESREYGRREPSRWLRGTLYPQTLALTSPTSAGHSVGIVHSRTRPRVFLKHIARNYCARNCNWNCHFGDLTHLANWTGKSPIVAVGFINPTQHTPTTRVFKIRVLTLVVGVCCVLWVAGTYMLKSGLVSYHGLLRG
jgi:hypothetical protein